MKKINQLINKPIGDILQEAGLINPSQLQVALAEKEIYSHLKLGEILALHGWVNQGTADFFGETINEFCWDRKLVIGDYFYMAHLLSQEEIDHILSEHKKLRIKFGSTAVLEGLIKQDTLDFFLKYFIIGKQYQNQLQRQNIQKNNNKDKIIQTGQESINYGDLIYDKKINNYSTNKYDYSFKTLTKDIKIKSRQTISNYYPELIEEDLDDVPWID